MRGCLSVRLYAHGLCFNPRSHEGSDSKNIGFTAKLGVSIHAPTRGATYRDTVEDGIAMVKQYIESLATDEKTKSLVSAIMRLLSRDGMGNLKASRVLQLRKMAEESNDDKFMEGVKIIEEAYQPTMTRQFIRAEYKDKKGQWHIIPLSVTDADTDGQEEAKK